ncbi:MAG: hypothetical protein Q8P66_03050 [Candidatus Colwellbacteria bacterium]|nr:hypothetical protein [Candidatus Colwellbacteria bacterium]
MARVATAGTVGEVKKRINPRLEAMLTEMHSISQEKAELERRHDKLRNKAFPLVEVAGDSYTTKDGVQGKIIRGLTWAVDPIGLFDRFGERVKPLLEVSPSKFRDAFDSGLLGSAETLSAIAHQEPTTPQLRVTKK